MSQSESGGLQAQVIPSHFPVFVWSWIHASGVIWSWLILTLPSVTVCPQFLSSQALEFHSSIDRILQTTSVSSIDRSFILEQVDCLFQDSDAWPALRSLYYLGVLPSFFPRTLNQSQIHSHLAHECHVFSIRLVVHWWLRSGLLPVALFVLN